MNMRLIDATDLVRRVLVERDKIRTEVVERYSFGVPTPDRHGQAMLGGIRKALREIETSPTVDAEPVRHGMWEDDNYIWKCNLCHKYLMIEQGDADMNYCPNCGAKLI